MQSSKQTLNVLGLVAYLMCVHISNRQITTKRLALAFTLIAFQEIHIKHLTPTKHVTPLKHFSHLKTQTHLMPHKVLNART